MSSLSFSKTSTAHTGTRQGVSLEVGSGCVALSMSIQLPISPFTTSCCVLQSPLKQDAFCTVPSTLLSLSIYIPAICWVNQHLGSLRQHPGVSFRLRVSLELQAQAGWELGSQRMVLEQGKSWLEGSIMGLVLVLSCLSASGGRFWLQLRHREEAANRRGPQLSPGTIASPQPLWGQIPAIQITPLPVPNLLGAAEATLSPGY